MFFGMAIERIGRGKIQLFEGPGEWFVRAMAVRSRLEGVAADRGSESWFG